MPKLKLIMGKTRPALFTLNTVLLKEKLKQGDLGLSWPTSIYSPNEIHEITSCVWVELEEKQHQTYSPFTDVSNVKANIMEHFEDEMK